MELDPVLATRRSLAGDCGESVTTSGFNLETTKEKEMTIMEKEMKISQTYRAASIATHAIDSAPRKHKSPLRGLMQGLGLAVIVCALFIGATGSASAGGAQDEAAVRALGDTFAKAFVEKNAELRASLFAENGTFVTPKGDYLRAGRHGEGLRTGGTASRQR